MSAGGVPLAAQRRLEELKAAGMTSSFLSASAAAVGAGDGVSAVGQVVGASACRLAVGVVRRTRGPAGRRPVGAPVWREHDGPIRSWTTARQRALARLSAQVELLGAHAVLAVESSYRVREGEPPVVEVVFTGTAVRISDPPSRIVRALVSVPEFCLLRRAGIDVLDIVGSCSAVEVGVGMATQRALAGRWAGAGNIELRDLTTGVYEARRLAVQRLGTEARRAGAAGVIGLDLWGGPAEMSDGHGGAIVVHLLGTAVRRRAGMDARRRGGPRVGSRGATGVSPQPLLGLN